MPNSVHLDQDIIWFTYDGPQNQDTASVLTPETLRLCEELQHQQKPVLMIVNVAGITSQNSGARRASADGVNRLPFDKMAIVGATLFLKKLGQFIINTSGKQDKVQYFDTNEQALEWLRT